MYLSAIVSVACLANLAFSVPLLAKKDIVFDIVTETVVVYVTAGDEIALATPVVAVLNPVVTVTAAIPTPTLDPVVVVTVIAPPTPTLDPIVVQTPPIPAPSSVKVAPSSVADGSLPAATDYKSTVLYWHNIHRRNNSAPDLVFDDKLASYALTSAQSCNFAHDLTPGNGGYGQNIADSGSTDSKESSKSPSTMAAYAIDMWYTGEINSFPDSSYGIDPPDFTNFESWGHYSQVVWKATTSVGCATHYCGSGVGTMFSAGWSGWYTVCNYSPAGNMGGGYGANIGRPLGHPTVSPA